VGFNELGKASGVGRVIEVLFHVTADPCRLVLALGYFPILYLFDPSRDSRKTLNICQLLIVDINLMVLTTSDTLRHVTRGLALTTQDGSQMGVITTRLYLRLLNHVVEALAVHADKQRKAEKDAEKDSKRDAEKDAEKDLQQRSFARLSAFASEVRKMNRCAAGEAVGIGSGSDDSDGDGIEAELDWTRKGLTMKEREV
jgi:hypothetical protein